MIVGPANDPAGIANMTPENAFTTLIVKGTNNTAGVYFVSRGDASGTHTAEQKIWSNAKYNYTMNVSKSGNWYVEAGKVGTRDPPDGKRERSIHLHGRRNLPFI